MRAGNTGLRALSVFAILFILGFGFIVYAVPQTAPAGTSDSPADYQDQSPTAVGAGLSYSLVPLPDFQGRPTPSNYPFQEGGALVVVYGTTLVVTTSFIGSAKTTFINVVQTAGANLTVGSVTTASNGGGVFHGNITLSPGTYEVGLLLFVNGQSSSPVAVSSPRAIQVTLGPTSSTSSHSTQSSTSSHAQSSSSSETSQSAAPTAASSVHRFSFQAATSATIPRNYSFGEGTGAYSVSGGTVYFSLSFTGQEPQAHYSIVLTVNGTARTIGDYTTSSAGAAGLGPNTFLGTGTFALSMSVVDDSTLAVHTTVLVSVPATITVNAQASTTSSTSTSTSSSSSHTTTATTTSTSLFTETAVPQGPDWTFRLTAADVQNAPKGYKFATSGTAIVTLDAQYSLLYVEIGFQGANPTTTYTAAITLNGTSVNLGTMTTNKDGGAVLKSSIQVNPGDYVLGILVYDISDIAAFGASGPVLVMVSNPGTQVAVLVPPGSETSSTSSSPAYSAGDSTATQTSVTTVTETATVLKGGTGVQSQIQTALQNLTIPASVQISPLASTTSVYDNRFSLSVGQVAGNGIVVAISGENVTGSRVLLINMSRTSPLALYPALNVTLDGVSVTEASSALQVLNPVSTNSPYYVLVGTSDSIQLLVSIPHFSLHLVQVSGVIVHTIQTALEVDGPLLVGSVIVVSLAFLAAYASRRRYFSVLL